MESPEVTKLQKEIRSLKKQVERLEASRATFELMVDRNDKLLSRQLEQTQRQADELNRIIPPEVGRCWGEFDVCQLTVDVNEQSREWLCAVSLLPYVSDLNCTPAL